MQTLTHQEWAEYNSGEKLLTKEMINNGWHFCLSWDDLLIGPDMGENMYCECSNGVYSNIKED